MQKKGFTCSL